MYTTQCLGQVLNLDLLTQSSALLFSLKYNTVELVLDSTILSGYPVLSVQFSRSKIFLL